MGAQAIQDPAGQLRPGRGSAEPARDDQDRQGPEEGPRAERLKVVSAFLNTRTRPWHGARLHPVIPPDCGRWSVDGAGFATSDLNDLYRRVINRTTG